MRHRLSRHSPYAPEALFGLVGDVSRYPEFVPWVRSLRTWNARTEADGAEWLDAEVERLVQRLLGKPREALAMGKVLFYRQLETGLAAAYQMAGHSMACNLAHPVAQEGVQAFIDKRTPRW